MKKAEQIKLELPHDAAFFLAQRIRSNVRELEGALKSRISEDIGEVADVLTEFAAAKVDVLVAVHVINFRSLGACYERRVAAHRIEGAHGAVDAAGDQGFGFLSPALVLLMYLSFKRFV